MVPPHPERMFAGVGRPRRHSADGHSRLVMGMIAVGMTFACLSFWWEQSQRHRYTVVEVRLAPIPDDPTPTYPAPLTPLPAPPAPPAPTAPDPTGPAPTGPDPTAPAAPATPE